MKGKKGYAEDMQIVLGLHTIGDYLEKLPRTKKPGLRLVRLIFTKS